jgi:hypothetical protein
MPFPYAYYQDNYNGPIHATTFKGNGYISLPAASIVSSGDISAAGQSTLNFNTSGSNIVVDSLTGIVTGQVVFFVKTTTANSLTLKNQSVSGTGTKFYTSTGSDIVLAPGTLGGVTFWAMQDGATLKLFEIKNSLLGDGSELYPSLAFGSDATTGLRKAVDGISFSLAGVEKFKVGTSIIAKNSVLLKDGLSGSLALGFEASTNTGVYRKASGEFALLVAGTEALSAEADGDLVIGGKFKKITAPFQFTNSSEVYTEVRMGSLGVGSSDAIINTKIPTNGIYAQGSMRTDGQFVGTATQALYADLAERYESDMILIPGTICEIGGEKEITIAINGSKVFGVISTNPGFKLNAQAGNDASHPYVALAGKTPCRLIGKIKKGDEVQLSAIPGVGELRKYSDSYSRCIGRALHDKETEEEGLVMIVTKALI